MQRVGVFVCWCGSNIAGTVDVEAVSEALKSEPGVVFSTNYQYMCSQAGQDMIKDAVKEHNLTGIVVCSCSPRMHEATFRKTAAAAGLNPYMVESGDIEPLLNSESLYKCLSCFACIERCPRGVEPAKLVEAVRLSVVRKQGANRITADDVPQIVDEDTPQQLLVSAFRKYTK